MVENKSSLFGIIAIIIGASGLGLGAFSGVNFQLVEGPHGPPGQDGQDGIDGIDGLNGSLGEVAGIWESLYGYLSPSTDYDIEFGDIKVNNSMYFFLSINNTRFTLTKVGWYRVSIRLLWEQLVSGNIYWLVINRNGAFLEYLETISLTLTDEYYQVNAFVYIISDGDDVFHFSCHSPDSFDIISIQEYNQLAIEYMGVQ